MAWHADRTGREDKEPLVTVVLGAFRCAPFFGGGAAAAAADCGFRFFSSSLEKHVAECLELRRGNDARGRSDTERDERTRRMWEDTCRGLREWTAWHCLAKGEMVN